MIRKYELPADMPNSAKAIVRTAVNALNLQGLDVTEVWSNGVSLFVRFGEEFQMVMADYKFAPENQSLVLWFNGTPTYILGGKFNDII